MDQERQESLRLLNGLESGSLSIADAYNIADKRDPLIVYFVLRYLREKYPASIPASSGVVGRIVELTKTYDKLVKKAKDGENDSLREWFDDTYDLKSFFNQPDKLVDTLIEKIES
jgi:hypothetical protein